MSVFNPTISGFVAIGYGSNTNMPHYYVYGQAINALTSEMVILPI